MYRSLWVALCAVMIFLLYPAFVEKELNFSLILLSLVFIACLIYTRHYYKKKENYDKAIIYYDEVIRQKPNLAVAYYFRGVMYGNKGDNDRAISDFDEAIRLKPNDAEAYCERGIAYLRKGNHDKAISDFNEAIRLNPNYVLAYYNRGKAYEEKRDRYKAAEDYESALRINPNYSDAKKALEGLDFLEFLERRYVYE